MIDGLDKKEVWLSMNYDLMSNGNFDKSIQAAADLLRSDHCQAAHVRTYTYIKSICLLIRCLPH